MPTYRWTGGKPLRRNDADDPDDRLVEQGEEFDIAADEDDGENDDPVGRAFSDLVEPVDESEPLPDRAREAGNEHADEVLERVDELLDGTVDEVEDALESGDYDDILDAVEAHAGRQGVQDAVESRR